MGFEDSRQARFVQGLSSTLEQMLDLQSISRAVGLQRYGNRMFRAEYAGLLLADLHCARLRQRLVNTIRPPEVGSSAKTSRSRVVIGSA